MSSRPEKLMLVRCSQPLTREPPPKRLCDSFSIQIKPHINEIFIPFPRAEAIWMNLKYQLVTL